MKKIIETAGWIALGIIIASLITSQLEPAVGTYLSNMANKISNLQP